jgi:hypothetical protein
MPEQIVTQTQVSFEGGLNGVGAPHNLAPDEVQSSTNVDYSLTRGAACPRRGSLQYASGGTGAICAITRNYGLSTGVWVDSAIPWYALDNQGTSWGFLTAGAGGSLTQVGAYSGGTASGITPTWSQYNGYIYLANGTSAIRTNGTSTFDWLLPQADTPTVVIAQQGTSTTSSSLAPSGGPFVAFAGTMTATEGTVTGSSTSTVFGTSAYDTVFLMTATTGTGSRIVLTAPVSSGAEDWENETVFVTLPTGTGVVLGTNGTYTLGGGIDFHQGYPGGDTTALYTGTATVTQTLIIGPFGVDYTLIGLTNQQNVVSIQRDLSIGDASFSNYWHYETTPSSLGDATGDPLSQMLFQQTGYQDITNQANSLSQSRILLPNKSGVHNNVSARSLSVSKASTAGLVAIAPWAVPRSEYSFVGALSNPDWRQIRGIRYIIEFSDNSDSVVLGGLVTYGGEGWPLTDQTSGISYFQTYARVENGFIVAEGAPSLPSAPQTVQFGNARLTCALSTNTTAGITHRVFYRTGGLLQDAYRIGSCTITSGTSTIYDYNLQDLIVINNPTLKRFLWSTWPDPSAGTGLPGVNALSTPWQSRIWIGVQNQLYWTAPGIPSKVQTDVQTTVGDSGDNIQAIVPAANLVIVNQNSVYEMSGSIFEGTAANWTLTRTASRRGSAAPRSVVSTPLGVLLFSFDGMSFYRQGWGIDQELSWVYDKLGDLWKGSDSTDPARQKGRIPPLNPVNIFNSCAAYKDEKIYLAVPVGGNTLADTVFVLDTTHQKVWMNVYPFNITSLYWDRALNRLMAGTDLGTVMQLETTLTDETALGVPQGIGWSYTTREWTTPKDLLMENLQVENIGTSTWLANIDGTNTYTLGTSTQVTKGWSPLSLQGSTGDNLSLTFLGTQSGTSQAVFGLEWDSIPEAKKVTFFQTDPIAIPSENYLKTWSADLNVLGTTGTVTGSVLVDGTVVQTATFTSTITGQRDPVTRYAYEVGFPNVTYGKNVTAVYHSPTPFRHHSTQFEMEPKPFGKTTWLVTYKKAGGVTQADMARFYAMDIEGLATNTVTNTWIIDGTVFSTNTLTFGATDSGEESGRVRNYMDWIPFPPGGRGYLFQQQMTASVPFKVWRASLDIDRIGIKGLSRVTQNGSPSPGSEN